MNKNIPGVIIISLTVILMAFLFTGCERSSGNVSQEIINFESYKDVPGVTEQEISAIESLRENYDHFIYGMPLSTEAFINEYGDLRGFSALFCQWLTELFGIEFRPQLIEWADLLAGLETGEVQFSGELTPTEARREIYEMTRPVAMRPLKYFRLENSEHIDDIIAVRPLLCGFIKGTATINAVSAALSPGTFEIVEIDDFSFVYDAFISGEIDVFYYSGVAEFNFIEYEDIVFNDFLPLIFMPVSLTAQMSEYAPVISVLEKALDSNDIQRFITELYNEGYQEYLRFKLFTLLTDEERSFIKARTEIPFAAENDNYPLSFFNARDGEWQGIAIDVLHEIEALTGLHFKRVTSETDTFAAMLRMLMTGEISLITDLMYTKQRSEIFTWTDTSLLYARSSLISKAEHRDVTLNDILHMNIGLIEEYAHSEFFRQWFPNHTGSVEYASVLDAFDALDRNEIDAVMVGDTILLILTNFLERPGHKIIYLFDNPYPSTFGFNQDEVILHSVMNKTLRLINTEMITEHWVRRTYDYQIKILEAQRPWIYGAFVTLFFIITAMTVVYIKGIKLTKQRTEAEIANKTKTTFLANMSHEIRTPMNSIVGFSELALDDDISPKTRGYLSNILENSEGLLQIINDILDISKIESGNMELEKVPFDPRDLLNACRTIITPRALDKGLELKFYTEPPEGRLPLGDPTRLRQVFVNLLSNAVKFTESGTVSFTAIVKKVHESSETVYIEVKDTGIGMTPEQIKDIFTPFKQAESETTRKYGGTGLGLAITKNLLEMMGAELIVESSPGNGSKFSFEMDFDTIGIPEEGVEKSRIFQKELAKPDFEGEVLLCEDNAMNQQVICEHLARVGLKTVVAENGRIGVDMVRNRMESGHKQFDLIFMDMHMPEMDGLEAAALINDLNTGIPIVAMTANIMTSDKERYEISGMSGYVGKPFTSQELWYCLLKFFKPVTRKSGDETDYSQADDELMQNLIRRFVEINTGKYDEITDAIDTGDITLAHRLVHTLKSNAGQLDKTALEQAAAVVEDSLKDGNDFTAAQQMQSLEVELNAVLAELTPLVQKPAGNGSTQTTEPVDKNALRLMLDDLEQYLEDKDPEALSFIDDLRAVPGSEVLIRQIEGFDFDLAVGTLASLKQELGILN